MRDDTEPARGRADAWTRGRVDAWTREHAVITAAAAILREKTAR